MAAIEAQTGHPIQNSQSVCPAHEDNSPSMTVRQGSKGVILKCHAGCSTAEVLASIGMTMRDLFDDQEPLTPLVRRNGDDGMEDWSARMAEQYRNGAPPPSPTPTATPEQRRLVCTYVYEDENRKPVLRVLRYMPKTFRQQRYDAQAEEWVSNLDGCRRPLFKLPEVLAAKEEGREIFVVEGEKDVLSLMTQGFVATTNPMGASKWLDEHTETLRGAEVIVIADNDKAGRASAKKIYEALLPVTSSVEVWLPAPGYKDISDQIEAGLLQPSDGQPWIDEFGEAELPYYDGTMPEDQEPEEEPQPRTPLSRVVDLVALFSAPLPEPEWICEPIIPKGSRAIHLYAPRGEGKSSLSLWIAVHLAMGVNPFNSADKNRAPLRVLYVDLEMSPEGLREYVERDFGFGLAEVLKMNGNLLYCTGDRELRALDTPIGGQEFLELVRAAAPDLVIVDSLGRATDGEENSNDTFNKVHRYTVAPLVTELGIASLWMGNSGKDGDRGSRGGSAKEDIMDFIWSLKRMDDGLIQLTKTKGRMNWVPDRVLLKRDRINGVFRYELDSGFTYVNGSRELAEKLFSLGLMPATVSVRKAKDVLTASNIDAPSRLIESAVRYLKTESMGNYGAALAA